MVDRNQAIMDRQAAALDRSRASRLTDEQLRANVATYTSATNPSNVRWRETCQAELDRRPRLVETTFGALAVGQDFVFSNYVLTGLLADLDRPGMTLRRKLSERTYTRVDWIAADGTVAARDRIGRLSAKVWVEA